MEEYKNQSPQTEAPVSDTHVGKIDEREAQLKPLIDKIKFPVYYDKDGQYVFDQDGNMVLELRGWGWIQYIGDAAEQLQDAWGNHIAELINRAHTRRLHSIHVGNILEGHQGKDIDALIKSQQESLMENVRGGYNGLHE